MKKKRVNYWIWFYATVGIAVLMAVATLFDFGTGKSYDSLVMIFAFSNLSILYQIIKKIDGK